MTSRSLLLAILLPLMLVCGPLSTGHANEDGAPAVAKQRAPYKVIVFIKRRADVPLKQFIAEFEGDHVKIVTRNLRPWLVKYVRRYVRPLADGSEPPYDAVTELWFRSQDDWLSARQTLGKPEVVAELARTAALINDSLTKVGLVEGPE
jgi:EthD domain